MRLGEFRTLTRELDNKLLIRISNYDSDGGYNATDDLEFVLVTDNVIYLRRV